MNTGSPTPVTLISPIIKLNFFSWSFFNQFIGDVYSIVPKCSHQHQLVSKYEFLVWCLIFSHFNSLTCVEKRSEQILFSWRLPQDQAKYCISNAPKIRDQPADRVPIHHSAFQTIAGRDVLLHLLQRNDDIHLAEGYRWRDIGKKPAKNEVTVRYFNIVQAPQDESTSRKATCSSKFRKYVYTLTEKGLQKGAPVIVWYQGDDGVAERTLHGNSKKDKEYVFTLPSVRNQIK